MTEYLGTDVSPCPFCGGAPKFNCFKVETGSGTTLYSYYTFGCPECEIYSPKNKNRTHYHSYVSFTLGEDGEIHIQNDDRAQDILNWNKRV